MTSSGKSKAQVLRVGVGVPEEPFAPIWRFWTHGDSAYLAVRTSGSIFKASFHMADAKHESAVWTFGFTSESKEVFGDTGLRRSHTWEQASEFRPGWYRGPAVVFPRLAGRKYDLPHVGDDDLSDVQWVDAPAVGNATFLHLLLSDARPDLPPLQLAKGESVVGTLPMANGWHLTLISEERPLQVEELPALENLLETRVGITDETGTSVTPRPGEASAAIVWVTTSAEGRPVFVQLVLGSDNYEQAGPGETERPA